MASLKAVAQIEHNVPGCIISIRIPSADILKLHADKTIVEINCKHFFNKLCKPTIQPTQQVSSTSSSTGANPDDIIFTKPTRITNRYDNIIDQLERKYYGESMVQANQEAEENSDDSAGSDGEEGDAVNDMDKAASAEKKVKAKSNKRKVNSDDYDVDDPFIDDEELIMEVETSLKTHRTKTKHDGFFVSSGKLEVFSPKKAQKTSSQATTKSAAPAQKKEAAAPAPAPAPEPEQVDEQAKEGEGSEKKKRKRRTKKEMEEAALAKSAPTSSPQPTDPAATNNTATPSATEAVEINQLAVAVAGEEGVASPEGAATFVAKSRPEKVLPPWMPDDESLLAMVQFKTTFEASGVKLFKSSHIPKTLEEPLHAVDVVVLKSISAENLQKTCGYYESLHTIMGGEVAIGKLRSLLARLRLRDRASAALQSIDDQVEALVRGLKSVVVPCPEKMQPAFKAAKKALSALAKAGDGETNKDKDSAEPRPEDEEAEGAEDTGVALNTSVDLESGVASPTAAAAPQGTRYEWFCNWSRPMKVTLCAIEHALKLWVIQENQYREKLTVHDKKYLSEKEVSVTCLRFVDAMPFIHSEIAFVSTLSASRWWRKT